MYLFTRFSCCRRFKTRSYLYRLPSVFFFIVSRIFNFSFFYRTKINTTGTTETVAFVWFVVLSFSKNYGI